MKVAPVLLIAITAAVAACGADRTAPTEPAVDAAITGDLAGLDVRGLTPAARRDLARARAATAGFHRFSEAEPAGYDFLFLGMCMDLPGTGGMGYHMVDTTALDATLDPAHPEALLYEPQANGKNRLVGLEYVIPGPAWTSPNPPTLFGREFTLNGFGLWALHVWLWKDNPAGMFEDWNPRVTCDHAAPTAAAAHGGHD